MTDLRTSAVWHAAAVAEYPGFYVMDPDGWDRRNYQYSWNEELISRDEFEKRAAKSTCSYPRKMLDDLINNTYHSEK